MRNTDFDEGFAIDFIPKLEVEFDSRFAGMKDNLGELFIPRNLFAILD